MEYSMKTIEKLLQDAKENLDKLNVEPVNGHPAGYESRCKVCNHEFLSDITAMREEGYSLREIQEDCCPEISLMSLSRHFRNHYTKSKRHEALERLKMLENVKEAYVKYPFLESYFKERPLEYLEAFNNEAGFCLDGFELCDLVPAGTVSDGNKTIKAINDELIDKVAELAENNPFRIRFEEECTDIKLDSNIKTDICLNCQNQIINERLLLLERIISYNFLNIIPENKQLYYELLHYDGDTDSFVQKLLDFRNEDWD